MTVRNLDFVRRGDLVLEVGPGRVLANMAKRAYPETQFIPVGTVADLAGAKKIAPPHVAEALSLRCLDRRF